MSKLNFTELNPGDFVKWQSAGGTMRGVLAKITIKENNLGELHPWLSFDRVLNEYNRQIADIGFWGTGSYLVMMKVEKL